MNYNMHSMEKTLTELHGMLKQAEQTLKDEGKHDMLMVRKGKPFKHAGKKKSFKGKKKKFPPKSKSAKGNKDIGNGTASNSRKIRRMTTLLLHQVFSL